MSESAADLNFSDTLLTQILSSANKLKRARRCCVALIRTLFPSGAAAMEQQQVVVDDKTKRMKLMRYWLIGTFIIVVSAITAYIMMWTQISITQALMTGLPIWGITLVTCLVIYF